MQSLPRPPGANPWLIRLLTLLLAAGAASSALYWVLKWPAAASALQPTLPGAELPAIDSDKIALLLGASLSGANASSPATADVQANYKLLGVIAQGGAGRQGARGSALIAVAGSPAKPYRVGEVVADGLVLHSVKARTAYLASDTATPPTVTLELPALK